MHLTLELSEVGFVVILSLHVKKQIRLSLQARAPRKQADSSPGSRVWLFNHRTSRPPGDPPVPEPCRPLSHPGVLPTPAPKSLRAPTPFCCPAYLLPKLFLPLLSSTRSLLSHQLLSRLLASEESSLHNRSFLDHFSTVPKSTMSWDGKGEEAGIRGTLGQGKELGWDNSLHHGNHKLANQPGEFDRPASPCSASQSMVLAFMVLSLLH